MPPILCGTFLAAMMAASISHYWSVGSFITDYQAIPAGRLVPDYTISPAPYATNPPLEATIQVAKASAETEDAHSKKSFENLIQELRNLRDENRTLTNQIAETNRDAIKMQFDIDTQSESFRSIPSSKQRDDRSQIHNDDLPSIVAPRAEPVFPLD